MDIKHAVYVRDLQAVLACDQSDGNLKKWAKDWLDEIEYQTKLVADLKKHPVLVA